MSSSAGSSENDSVRHHEKILRSTHELYVGDEDSVDPSPYSLEGMAKTMGMTVLHPLRKVTVMLIGNHSAGKSSFVNWYTDDVVQKAGMAVETQGFTFVVQGKREMIKAPLKGESTIEMFPHIKGIEEIGGDRIVEHLQTRVSTKRSKSFPLVQFIDKDGDGEIDCGEVSGQSRAHPPLPFPSRHHSLHCCSCSCAAVLAHVLQSGAARKDARPRGAPGARRCGAPACRAAAEGHDQQAVRGRQEVGAGSAVAGAAP